MSCEKESDNRELNIDVSPISKSAGINETYPPEIHIYPNPFSDVLFFYIDGADSAIVNISNDEGYKKVDYTGNTLGFDFSSEKSGSYNCEVLLDGKVHKLSLIKL